MRFFLCGDVMTGRGIDLLLPHPGNPAIFEPHIRSARDYVALAERVSGAIPSPVTFDYVWGDALAEMDRRSPDLRIVNLETGITTNGKAERSKAIHYRMHPANIGCITAANIDCCVLANNHVADWGMAGLADTLAVLSKAGIATAGAGIDAKAAAQPAILHVHERRVLVFAFGRPSAGIPAHWMAEAHRPGVNVLPRLDDSGVSHVVGCIERWRQAGDLVVISIHWGPNWGYDIPQEHRRFAHRLVEEAGINLLHGHSSHHPIGMEVYHGTPILYGCGDFINDYEGIGGHESFRPDLALAYFLDIGTSDHGLDMVEMVPFRSRRLRLQRAAHADAAWLANVLDRQSRGFGHRVRLTQDDALTLS